MRHQLSLLCVCLTFLLCVQASFADIVKSKSPGYIRVFSAKSKELNPDTVELNFSVKTFAKTVEEAAKSNKQITNNLVLTLKSKIDKSQGDVVKTINYSVSPKYKYPKNAPKVIVGYDVRNTVDVKTKNMSDVGSIIDAAIKSGANDIGNLTFSLSDGQDTCDALYPSVAKDVKNQASIIAKSIGANLSGVKTLRASCNVNNPTHRVAHPIYYRAAMKVDSLNSTPIEKGKIKVRASITAEFYVK